MRNFTFDSVAGVRRIHLTIVTPPADAKIFLSSRIIPIGHLAVHGDCCGNSHTWIADCCGRVFHLRLVSACGEPLLPERAGRLLGRVRTAGGSAGRLHGFSSMPCRSVCYVPGHGHICRTVSLRLSCGWGSSAHRLAPGSLGDCTAVLVL